MNINRAARSDPVPPFVFKESHMPTNTFKSFLTDLTIRFPERKDVVDGALAAVLAGEHGILPGPHDR
jgi:hypothetical protein